jgi:hypothetical protein
VCAFPRDNALDARQSPTKREEFLKSWLTNSQEPFTSIKENRLWLRRGIRPLLTGKPDEILRQGTRCAILDQKFGAYRVADPAENVQLSIYITRDCWRVRLTRYQVGV